MERENLEQYRNLCLEIKELEAEKEALAQGMIPSSWPIVSRHSEGLHKDIVAENAKKMFQLSEMIAKRLNELVKLRTEIEVTIGALPLQSRLLLRFHYIDGLTWNEVAEKMGYSQRHIFRMRNKILDKYFPEDKSARTINAISSDGLLKLVSGL